MLSRGQQLLEEGRFEDALACFQESQDPRALFGRAVALQLLGRLEEADASYDELLGADPNHREALANLIALNVERFDLRRVELYARRLLEVAPDHDIALRGMIVVAVEQRDYELAARCFGRLSPDQDDSRDSVEYRLSAQTMERLKDHHGSITHPY